MITDNHVLDSFLRHGEEFRVLFGQLAERRGVHAYLITGPEGSGKRTLAELMAGTLLCSADHERPCGTCRDCLLSGRGEHPDLIVIEKGSPIAPGIKKDRTTIPVEDIREMIRICGIRPADGNMHIVIIRGADRMTPQAQNCLLKTLEDPPPDTCIILTTCHMESLLTTVVSRCRILRMKAWEDEYILSVLLKKGIPADRAREAAAASNGSIGKAVESASDEEFWKLRSEVMELFFTNTSPGNILKISNQWKERKQNSEEVLSILESYILRMYEARYGKGDSDLSAFPGHWQRFAAEAGKENFANLADAVREARRQIQYSVNFQAVLEKIIFIFMGEGKKWLQ